MVEQKNIEQIIIATPSAKAREMRKIVTYCETTGVDFKTVPGPRELMNGNVTLNQLRDLKIEDLLGRDAVNTDGERIAEMIRGGVVMVTGAGGSIGQELCWQIMEYKPEKLVMFDHSENSLFYLSNELQTRWAGGFATVVGSVCDPAKVDRVMSEFKPAMVSHAAAHKHVPLMEMNPEEAIKNNLKGTMTLAGASEKHNVRIFVLISTDKAVELYQCDGRFKAVG
ncbi:polysaccharide biosynthesis protein [candidate division KSB1 bacterium]|nr:polysaccharide biosynthesis protein [candidate division KSB1 bacterium]